MGKNKELGVCALCRQKKELQLSHIIPNFVGRKMKKTSPVNIRSTNEPNRIAQDIEKHYLLCHDCEELFSEKERWFANNIFNPWIDQKQVQYNYDENLTYFIISLSWRSLYLDLEEFTCDSSFNKDILMIMIRAESVMRDYLLGKRKDISDIQNHIFFNDRVKSVYNADSSDNLSVTLHRSLSSYSAYNGKTSFTISNLMGIMIITFYSMDSEEEWTNTQIVNGSSTVYAQNQRVKSVVGQEIQHWMSVVDDAQKEISNNQKTKISEKIKKLGDDFKNYAIYQDLLDDDALKKQ